jgi:SAM-dependent methyltransferase
MPETEIYEMNLKEPICRICNAQNGQKVRAEHVYGGRQDQNFWHCGHCDAVYLSPPPTEEEEAVFYYREFENFMDKRSGGDRDWSGARRHIQTNQDQVRRRMPFLEQYLTKGNRLLEIGCSSGFMLQAFKEKGVHCTGIEPSGVFSDYLKESGDDVFTSLEAVEDHRVEPFDLIVSFFVLEHIRDPFDFIGRSLSLLKDGGSFIAEVPCVNDPLTHIYHIPAFERFYWSVAHHYYYNPKSLAFILDKMGVRYKMVPEQRYDLSNHMVWMSEGKPGGQGRFDDVFTRELIAQYKRDLKAKWLCDTIFLYIHK